MPVTILNRFLTIQNTPDNTASNFFVIQNIPVNKEITFLVKQNHSDNIASKFRGIQKKLAKITDTFLMT